MRKLPYPQCRGEQWEKARMRALVRDNFTCQAHQLGLTSEPCKENHLRSLNVHHKQERQHGGDHDLDNLITLCRAHHIMVHPHMARELYAKERVLGDEYGREL